MIKEPNDLQEKGKRRNKSEKGENVDWKIQSDEGIVNTYHDGSAVLCICIYMSCGYRKGNGRYGKDQSIGKYGQ